jgi:singapore isolate B (sub-type 7) whole genome shotgun sequence assembly, scaffold_0
VLGAPLVLLAEKEYVLQADLQLARAVPQRVFAPRFKKPKNYSYFVTVLDADDRILVRTARRGDT